MFVLVLRLAEGIVGRGFVFWVALILLTAGAFSTAHAGPNANARILLHLLAPTTENACTRAAASPVCSGIVTAGGLYPQAYFSYLLVTDADSAAGIAGVQCGINYMNAPHVGVDIYSWTNCATLESSSGGWPMSGSGNLITWDSSFQCQRNQPGGPGSGVVAIAGYFYCTAYGLDTLRVTTRPVDLVAKVAGCGAVEDIVDAPSFTRNPNPLGFAVFSDGSAFDGYNPCGQEAPLFEPVWQFELPEPTSEPEDSTPAGVTFPQPTIVRNAFRVTTSTPHFPLQSITLFRVISLSGGFELQTLTSTVPINDDGSLGGPTSRPVPIESIGISVAGPPCLGTLSNSSGTGGFRLFGNGMDDLHSEPTNQFDAIHFHSNTGIAIGTNLQETEVFALNTGRAHRFPGFCTASASNKIANIASLAVKDVQTQTHHLLVVDGQGVIVMRKELPTAALDIGLQADCAIVNFSSAHVQREVMIGIPLGVMTDMPPLPAGLRTFSEDGSSVLIQDYGSNPNVLYFYDIGDPLRPALLWTRPMPFEQPSVTAMSVSPSGRLVAYQVYNKAKRNSVLAVVSREGADLGVAVHADPYLVDGLAFVDDRFLLEGVYRRGHVLSTRTGRLYDLGQVGQ